VSLYDSAVTNIDRLHLGEHCLRTPGRPFSAAAEPAAHEVDVIDLTPGQPRRTDPLNKLLVTPDEAAELLSIGRSKLYELLAEGAVESVRVGTCRRIPVQALKDFVSSLRHTG